MLILIICSVANMDPHSHQAGTSNRSIYLFPDLHTCQTHHIKIVDIMPLSVFVCEFVQGLLNGSENQCHAEADRPQLLSNDNYSMSFYVNIILRDNDVRSAAANYSFIR
jgi:hypothetical protein